MAMHEDQLQVSEATVRRLVDEQFPRWKDLAVRQVPAAGTVNAVFRIGDEFAARFPLCTRDPTQARAELMTEAAAAREFASASTVPTPEPVAIGEPGHGYPLPWSIQTWLAGLDATVVDPAGSIEFANDLAAFVVGLRATDTAGRRFTGAGRGGHLPDHDAWMEVCFGQSAGLLDVARLRVMWARLRRLPEVDADVMCHGDLIPPNVLVGGGRLVGVLDGGGYAAADPALDLVGAWHLLDESQRQVLRDALGCSDVQWQRGMAWAYQQSMGLVWYYAESNPTMSRWGRRTLDRLIREGAGYSSV
jgi:aminoglycoside phosphotransferase (APT) family kinase protein